MNKRIVFIFFVLFFYSSGHIIAPVQGHSSDTIFTYAKNNPGKVVAGAGITFGAFLCPVPTLIACSVGLIAYNLNHYCSNKNNFSAIGNIDREMEEEKEKFKLNPSPEAKAKLLLILDKQIDAYEALEKNLKKQKNKFEKGPKIAVEKILFYKRYFACCKKLYDLLYSKINTFSANDKFSNDLFSRYMQWLKLYNYMISDLKVIFSDFKVLSSENFEEYCMYLEELNNQREEIYEKARNHMTEFGKVKLTILLGMHPLFLHTFLTLYCAQCLEQIFVKSSIESSFSKDEKSKQPQVEYFPTGAQSVMDPEGSKVSKHGYRYDLYFDAKSS